MQKITNLISHLISQFGVNNYVDVMSVMRAHFGFSEHIKHAHMIQNEAESTVKNIGGVQLLWVCTVL